MEILIARTLEFLQKATPEWQEILIFSPFLLLYVYLAQYLVSYLRVNKKVHYAYTRKIFHFCIFIFAGILQIRLGLSSVILFGSIVSIFVLYATFKGEASGHFKAMARTSDRPREKTFILIPLITTALGGVLANIFFGTWASIGYLVGGAGDAIGEPVGTKWGKHPYNVPSIAGVPAQRTLEGSMGIFVAGSIMAVLGFWLQGLPSREIFILGLLCGFGGTLTEAISNHGIDNFTIQLVVSGIAFFLANY